jgi:hypothetical protein
LIATESASTDNHGFPGVELRTILAEVREHKQMTKSHTGMGTLIKVKNLGDSGLV